jgi:hypothetical protein
MYFVDIPLMSAAAMPDECYVSALGTIMMSNLTKFKLALSNFSPRVLPQRHRVYLRLYTKKTRIYSLTMGDSGY